MSFSSQQVSEFWDQGYVIVDDVFDPEDLEPIRLELEREIGIKIDELVRSPPRVPIGTTETPDS